ncbi:HU family DNA-binding protein [Microcoleus sp. Pol11C1]|uniref:HU family DNA-binding protein n=1 Tax=unclassified Microcoleus TaxID=2642155 RepID=UPI002FD15551
MDKTRANKMDKQKLLETIAERRGLNFEAVAEDLSFAYDEIFKAIVEAVASGQVVDIPGFGVFRRSELHLGRARQPSTKKIPDFSPDLKFKDAVREGVYK